MSSSLLSSFWRISRYQWLVLLLMIAVGIASRFYLFGFDNIKPIAAMVLFGGFFFRNAILALAAALLVMILTDTQIGTYQWQTMLAVYGSLALGVVMGMRIRRKYGLGLEGKGWVFAFAISSLTMSGVFYLISNGAVWYFWNIYPPTAAGLLDCYVAGLPFLWRTVCGDLFFTSLFLGGYCLVARTIGKLFLKDATNQLQVQEL
jgi:hypothetical protein